MRSVIALFCALLGPALPASAQTWPRAPIKFITPFPPGGAADILSRTIAQYLSTSLGQSVVVENRAGVAGSVGAAALAHSAGDGYTIGLGTLSSLALNPFMQKTPLYDPRKDFTPIAMLTELPILMGLAPSLPGDFAGFIDYAKKKPGGITYSSNGVGSSGHILGEMVRRKFGFSAAHAPYGGDIPIINALIGGQIDMGTMAIPAAVPFVKDAKFKAPAMMGRTRSPIIPDIPSITELGYPDLVSTTWFSVVGPAGLPRDIVLRLNADVNKALASPETLQVFKGGGLEPNVMPLAEFEKFVKDEQDRWEKTLKELGLQVE